MKRVFKHIVLVTLGLFVCALVALPFAVPPIARHLIETRLLSCGVPADVKVRCNYIWTGTGPGFASDVSVSLINTPWVFHGRFSAAAFQWHVRVSLPETTFDGQDGAVRQHVLQRLPSCVSNVVCSGSVSADLKADRSWSQPLASWSANVRFQDVTASALCGPSPARVEGVQLTASGSGIGDHVDISPLRLRARTIAYAQMRMDDLRTTIHPVGKSLLVNEATATFCGGRAALYSLFLDPAKLNAGFTLFLEDVEAGKVLACFPNVRGSATGRLHGKLRLFLQEGGRALRFRDAFLYSVPGEIGKLKLEDASAVTENLALAGVASDQCSNVARALGDLDYRVLRFEMRRESKEDTLLIVRVEGTSTKDEITVPVDLNVRFRGDIEQLVNTGLKLTGKRKE